MYKHLGIDDWLFVALYGAVAMMARLRMTDEKIKGVLFEQKSDKSDQIEQNIF